MDPEDLLLLSTLEHLDYTADSEEHLAVFLKNTSDYVGKKLVTNREVPGRLLNSEFADFYENIVKAPKDMVAVYTSGYEIPFENGPPPQCHDTKNNALCVKEPEFCWQELQRLLALGCVREVSEGDSEVILPLSAVFSNKMRYVVDASRHLPLLYVK